MQLYIVETKIVAKRMDMHFANTFGVISSCREFSGERVCILPHYIVFVADTSVMTLFHSSMKRSSSGNAAWACAVCVIKDNAFCSEGIGVGFLHQDVRHIPAVASKLIGHNEKNIRLFHFVSSLLYVFCILFIAL